MSYSTEREFVSFQVRRNCTLLFKRFLEILERNKDEHDECLGKLYDMLPEDYKNYVDLADYFTESKFDSLRKEILAAGNDTIRNIDEILKEVDIGPKNHNIS